MQPALAIIGSTSRTIEGAPLEATSLGFGSNFPFSFPFSSNTRTTPDRKSALTSVAWPKCGKAAFVTDEDGALWSYAEFKWHTGAQSSEAARERKLKDFGDEMIHAL